MDSQIKKGSLELCILLLLSKKDCYGYLVSKIIGEKLNVKEGTLYLILQRLEKTNIVESYKVSSSEKKVRKYYKLTDAGVEKMNNLINDYNAINNVIDSFINGDVGESDE